MTYRIAPPTTHDTHRSLFRRLLLGFMSVMLGIWLGALVWDIHETKTTSKKEALWETKRLTRQILVSMQPLADRPEDIRHVVRRIEEVREALFKERSLYPDRIHIQVWKAHDLLYSSVPGLSETVPSADGSDQLIEESWVSWVETDPESGITVRVNQEVTGQWVLDISSIGYYLLPLLYSFPFLLLPAWFIIGVGLRPLKSIVTEIEERSASDLSPLEASPYKELSPLVKSVNRLMERLTARLEREQEFLLDAAHELKTPLAIIQINADSLLHNADPRSAQAAQEGLHQGVSRATHTVHQLLALARSDADRESADLQPMDLAEFLRDRIALEAHIALQRGIDIELQSPESCVLPLHRESMASLIDNLIANAVKYSPDKGHIVVSLILQSQTVQLMITDEGPGIPAELRKKVFERFFRLPDQDQAGSGLGLAIAERAAVRNNASIRLEAGPGGRGLAALVEIKRF